MPRRKQIRPTRMKYSEDGKVIKEEADDEGDHDGSSEDDDDEESDGDDTQQSDDVNDDNVASDNEIKTAEKDSDVVQPESDEEFGLKSENSEEKVDNFEESKDEIDALESITKNIENFEKNMHDSDENDSNIRTKSDTYANMLVTSTPSVDLAQPMKRKCSFEMERSVEHDLLRNNYPSSHETVMDLSAKRPKLEHSSSDVSQSSHKPNTYHSSSRNSSIDPSQPLDLSQKSSRKATPESKGSTTSIPLRNSHHEHRNHRRESRSPYHNSRNNSRESRSSYQDSRNSHREHDTHGTAISPSLASLQQKFGSNLGYWYNGCYPQFPHMNYVFSHLKIPSQYDVMQYDKRSLEGWYGKIMPSITHPVSRQTQILKPALPSAAPRPVSNASGVRRSPSSVTSTASSSRPSASLPISKPPMDIPIFSDTKTALKGNCTDYKCDCSKAYSSLYELSVHMQDTGHMPRNTKIGPSGDYPKLVRGQDMWLNSGSEQTKQILRCMQCGESFKSLPELTVHMMKTQHYADIFSSAHRKLHKCTTFFEKENDTKSVFKCRVCDTEYDSLDGLANHMVESKHHKKQGWRFQNSSNGSSARPKVETSDNTDGLNRKSIKREQISKEDSPKPITSIKREIIDNDVLCEKRYTAGKDEKGLNNSLLFDGDKNGDINHNDTSSEISDDEVGNLLQPCKEEVKDAIIKEFIASGHSTPSDLDEDMATIRCENCLERIHTDEFVEHVRVCISKKSQSEVIGKLKAKLTARSRSCSDGDDECLSDDDDEKDKSRIDENLLMNGSHNVVKSLRKSLDESKDISPLTGKLPKSKQEPGSALKAMEHFIDNFNEKRLTKSRHGMKARSLLYNVPNVCNYPSISPLVGNNNYIDSSRFLNHETKPSVRNEERRKNGSDTEDRGRSPRGTSPPNVQNFSPKYERMIENENGGGALHSLYKFASMDPRKVAPKLRAKLDQKPDLLQTGSDNPITHSPQPIRLSPTPTKVLDTNEPVKRSERSRDTPERAKNHHSPVREIDRTVSRDSDGPRQDLTGKADCDRLRDSPSPGSGKNQYLRVEPESPSDSKSNGSALDSLKGLVVKHMEKGEHPLNSLQKLINSTDGNHGPTITSLQSKLVQNGPVWYSMSNSVFSPNKLLSPHSRSGSPVPERGVGGPGAMDLTPGAHTNSDHGSHSSDSDEETKPSDLKCDFCGKVFSSKGGCRYHRSKCPQNVPRGMGGREARIVRTPYMYMPPEHTNKFSKYYEMARELANKSK
ncbi:uncharacterized protein LOC135495388 [Lineus longissimus]|uniref:uncharacterized protein LOC135495388 n=1 Tax=Lineus longissimus TaxID=88925 RepID=UPI002B4DD4A5